MTDLDARIRAGLDEGDWSTRGLSNALRSVLDLCDELDQMPWYGGAGFEIKELIAEELGVSDD